MNGRIVIPTDRMKITRGIVDSCIEFGTRQFTRKATRVPPVWGRGARPWIIAAFLATTWASETQAFPEARDTKADALANTQHAIAARNVDFGRAAGNHDFETVQSSLFGDKSVLVAQAATGDTAELGKALEQEHRRSELFERLLTLPRAPAESARSNLASESENAGLRKSLQQVRDRLKQTSENGAAALCKSLQGDREDGRLEQALAAARRDVETQTALATKANEDATQLKQAAESDTAELNKSLQQERERARQLEQALAAARRDVETQTALAAKANEDATQSKQVAERDSSELKRSLQKEHDRAEALTQDLSLAHSAIYAYEAQTRSASDRAAGLKQVEESSATELRKSLVQEWERAASPQREFAAARCGVEMQTALTAKADAEAARLRRAAESGSAELKRSLQPERDRVAGPEQEPVSERRTEVVSAVSAVVTFGQVTQDKQVGLDAPKSVAVDQTSVAKAQGEAQLAPENAAEAARLVARASVLLSQGDIGSARIVLERAAETGSAQANFTLAETYDPVILRKWGTYGTRGDAAKARDLYAKAQAGGIKQATERLDALRH